MSEKFSSGTINPKQKNYIEGVDIVTRYIAKNERKSEQAHIPHAPTLLENAVYNKRQFQTLGTGNRTKKGI